MFSLGTEATVNASGGTYVAYLFAHDAGGFGDDGEQNVISCGSYTVDALQNKVTVDLGYEPQWVMIKRTDSSVGGAWHMFDNMRGIATGGDDPQLQAQSSNSEAALGGVNAIDLTSAGFETGTNGTVLQPSGTYIYIAIRRGPMKTPESGTEVFAPVTRNSSGGGVNYYTGFPVDLAIYNARTGPGGYAHARLTSGGRLQTVNSNAEISGDVVDFASNVGYQPGNDSTNTNALRWMGLPPRPRLL